MAQSTMKAIRVQAYGGPEQLRFEDVRRRCRRGATSWFASGRLR